MAEIEHFVDPSNKDHPKFAGVSDNVLPLYPQANQLGDKKLVCVTAKEAVASVCFSSCVIKNIKVVY